MNAADNGAAERAPSRRFSSGGLGDGGAALQGRFDLPAGVAVGPSGALFVLDLNRIRVISN
jgi:hypothetical protein